MHVGNSLRIQIAVFCGGRAEGHTPLTPALGRQSRWISVNSRPAWSTEQVPGQAPKLKKGGRGGRERKGERGREKKEGKNECCLPIHAS